MRYPAWLKIFSLLLVFLLTHTGTAQVAYHNFNSNDGLPSNEVYSVFQDHQGFLWFGTDHGVVKYNGYNFKTFTTTDGLTDNTILEIKGDAENNIWFLTLSGGMCCFDGRKFTPHPQNETIKKLFDKRLPTSWEVLHNKQIWLGFVEEGFAKIDTDKVKIFSLSDTIPDKNDSVRIYVIHLGANRFVYASIVGREMQKVRDPQITAFDMYRVGLDFSRVNFKFLLFGNNEAFMGLERFLVYIDSNKHATVYEGAKNNLVLKVEQTPDSKIWVLQKNNYSYSIKASNGKINTLDSIAFTKSASSLLVDLQGNQWITTLDHGIYMVPNSKIKIYNIHNASLPYKLSCINTNGKYLFVGLPEGRMLKVDQQLNSSISSGPQNGKGPTAMSSINFKLNGDPQSNLDTSFLWFTKFGSYHTKALPIDNQKTLLGATNGFALLSSNHQVIFNSQQIGFIRRITELCKLSERTFAIGTLTGLYYYQPGYNNRITEEKYLSGVRITAVKKMDDSLFGVATRGKGIAININNKFYSVNEQKGLISDLAEDLYFENDSLLWEASFKGISKIYFRLVGDSLVCRIKNYTKEDGLCSNQVNGITGFNGFIWLATNEGLCYLNPKDLEEKTTRIPLFFDNISVNGVTQPADSLTLNHDQNNIFIEFNALYYKAIQGIRYKVRLKGIEPWKYTTLNSVQYFSLPPGNYQFEVAAEDADGKYKSDIHTLKFIIQPRFSDTILFKILIGTLILIAVVLIVSSIFSYQKLKATNVIKLLQAEFKALSYQINPHFIFNVLNSIQYYILKKDTDNAVHLLGSFSLLIRRIVNNSKQQYIGIIEEVECLKEYMDLEKMRLDNKFEYTINIDSSIDIEEKNILPMIIQPMAENSIWHGIVPSSKPGIITINFKKENGAVICTVEDNGVGINIALTKEKSQNNLSLAMKNVSERLKIIGELNDSTWAIKTEDRSLTDSTQSGTVVTIIFPALKDKK